MKRLLLVCTALSVSISISASNLANPAITLPEARVSIGASYHLGGYTLTDLEIPSLFNRVHARCDYAPWKHLTIGIDAGATQIEVDKFAIGNDSFPIFHGNYGFSGGGHIKLSTPSFLQNRLSLVMIGQATVFESENSEVKCSYRGIDGCGAVGFQWHIPGFGFVSAGPLVYLIQGENKSFDGSTSFYSNTNNVRGWLAIDYFPKVTTMSANKPYMSFEVSISPKANYSDRVPFKEISASVSIGVITKRLYGTENEVEWNP